MTEELFQQLRQRIENLKNLPIDKSIIIASLQNRLKSIESTQSIAADSESGERQEQQLTYLKKEVELSELFQQNILEKLELLEKQIETVRPSLLIPAEPSITYDKITNTRVRNQLLADNIRMEHALVDLQIFPDFGEELAFRRFCAFAFFQVEELLNFYYNKRFRGDIREIIIYFRRIGVKLPDNPQSLSNISTASKIFAYNHEFSDSFNLLNPIRLIRNKEQHRCTVQVKEWEFSILEKKHEELKLKEKRSAARELGGYYTLSQEEKEIEENYIAIRFIRQKNHELVREVLNKIYIQVTK